MDLKSLFKFFLKLSAFCFAAVFSLLLSRGSEAARLLARNGEAAAAVIISESASDVEKHAAAELSYFLGKVTGARIMQSAEPVRGKYGIWVGTPGNNRRAVEAGLEDRVQNLSSQGYMIFADGGGMAITGKKPLGVLFGAYGFLEEHAGMRWFFPGEEGEYAPENPNLSIPDIDETENPAFKVRMMRLHGTAHSAPLEETRDWLARNRMQMMYPINPAFAEENLKRGNYPYGGGHILHRIVPDELFEENPEYFGLYDGERRKQHGHRGQPCTTHPEVINLAVEYLLDWFEANPDGLFTLNNNDWPRFCECENCTALDPPEEIGRSGGSLSTRFFTFKNEVARRVWKSRPEARIRTLAYQRFRLPPAGVVPDSRLLVDLCDHGRCFRHSIDDPDCGPNAWFRGMFDGWAETGNTRGYYPYYNTISSGAPPMERVVADDMRYMHRLGHTHWTMITMPPDGSYAHIERRGRDATRQRTYWRANLHMHYLQAKLAWNPDINADELLRDLNEKFYGPAAGAMGLFREKLLDLWEETPGHFIYGSSADIVGRSLLPPGALEELLGLLDEAGRAADGLAEYEARVDEEREIFERTWMRIYGETVDDPDLIEARGRISGNFEKAGGMSGAAVKFHEGAYLETENLYNNMPELTVSFFIRQPAVQETAMHILGNNRSHSAGSPGFRFLKRRADRGDGYLEFRVSDGSTMRIATTDKLPAGEWAHVAGVFEGGEAISLYINGERVSRIRNPLKDTGESGSAFRIGLNEGGESSLPGMMIDSIRIEDRALSEDEIRDLYGGLTAG